MQTPTTAQIRTAIEVLKKFGEHINTNTANAVIALHEGRADHLHAPEVDPLDHRGSRQNQPEILISEWTIGPYYREVVLPQPVDGALTNATYGNGVLVLAMPMLNSGEQGGYTEFRLEADKGARGQRVGHTGSDIQPATPRKHHQRVDQTTQ